MKQTYKTLKIGVIEMSNVDVLAKGSAEATDMPFLADVYSADDWGTSD